MDYKSAGCCASLYAKQLIQNDLIVRALDKGGGFQDLHPSRVRLCLKHVPVDKLSLCPDCGMRRVVP